MKDAGLQRVQLPLGNWFAADIGTTLDIYTHAINNGKLVAQKNQSN